MFDEIMKTCMYLLYIIIGSFIGYILYPEEPMSGFISAMFILVSSLWLNNFDKS